MKLAVIKTGGKQYKVQEGQKLKVEKLPQKPGEKVNFTEVLLVAEGEEVQIGAPILKQAKVEAEVLAEGKGKKVEVVKFKSKTRYRRHYGHRQPYTEIQIKKISF